MSSPICYIFLHIDSKLSWKSMLSIYYVKRWLTTYTWLDITEVLCLRVLLSVGRASCYISFELFTTCSCGVPHYIWTCFLIYIVSVIKLLQNWVTCGYDHVSDCKFRLHWLPLDLLIQHHALKVMCIGVKQMDTPFYLLKPPIVFGCQHIYTTWISIPFC